MLLMSFFQGVLWYVLSFREGKLLALGGNSGNFIYNVCPVIVVSSPEFHQIFPINGTVYRFTRNEILVQAFIPGNHADMNLALQ